MACPMMKNGSKSSTVYLSPLIRLEVLLCASVLLGSFGYMIYVVSMYSEYFNHGGPLFGMMIGRRGLHKGWGWIFPNRMHDLTDGMWRRFEFLNRLGTPLWYIGAAVLRHQLRKRLPQHERIILTLFYVAYSVFVHRGAKVIVLFAYILMNFYLAKLVAGRKHGWGMGDIHLKIPFLLMFFKCISYGVDLHWARIKKPSFYKILDESTEAGAYKARIDRHLLEEDYNDLLAYIQYQLYPSLYIEGPIMTFNDFVSQIKGKPVRKEMFWYGLRAFTMYCVLQLYFHFVYAEAIAQNQVYIKLWSKVSDFTTTGRPKFGTLSFLSLINCCYLNYYLTHLVMWKIARFWALVDGIDCPDDFTKCIGRCLNMREVWKHWHASLSKWCTRYVFVPLGGSKGSRFSTCINIGAVFTVTALWHSYDLDFALWGMMLTGFLAVETVVMWCASTLKSVEIKEVDKTKKLAKQAYNTSESSQRILALGASIPILGFIFINMATFTFEQNETWMIVKALLREPQYLAWFYLMAYCNQRLVTIHDDWTRRVEEKKTQ